MNQPKWAKKFKENLMILSMPEMDALTGYTGAGKDGKVQPNNPVWQDQMQVHEGEYVIKASDVKKFGGPSGLEKKLGLKPAPAPDVVQMKCGGTVRRYATSGSVPSLADYLAQAPAGSDKTALTNNWNTRYKAAWTASQVKTPVVTTPKPVITSLNSSSPPTPTSIAAIQTAVTAPAPATAPVLAPLNMPELHVSGANGEISLNDAQKNNPTIFDPLLANPPVIDVPPPPADIAVTTPPPAPYNGPEMVMDDKSTWRVPQADGSIKDGNGVTVKRAANTDIYGENTVNTDTYGADGTITDGYGNIVPQPTAPVPTDTAPAPTADNAPAPVGPSADITREKYTGQIDSAIAEYQKIAQGNSPMVKKIVDMAYGQLDPRLAAQSMVLAMQIAQNPTMSEGAKRAAIAGQMRDAGIAQADLAGTLATQALNMAMDALGKGTTLSQNQQGFFDDMSKYQKTEGWKALDMALRYGSDADVIAQYKTVTGKDLDPASVNEVRGYDRSVRENSLTGVKLALGDSQYRSIQDMIAGGSTYEQISARFPTFTRDQFSTMSYDRTSGVYDNEMLGLESDIASGLDFEDVTGRLQKIATSTGVTYTDTWARAFFTRIKDQGNPVVATLKTYDDHGLELLIRPDDAPAGWNLSQYTYKNLTGRPAAEQFFADMYYKGGITIKNGNVTLDPVVLAGGGASDTQFDLVSGDIWGADADTVLRTGRTADPAGYDGILKGRVDEMVSSGDYSKLKGVGTTDPVYKAVVARSSPFAMTGGSSTNPLGNSLQNYGVTFREPPEVGSTILIDGKIYVVQTENDRIFQEVDWSANDLEKQNFTVLDPITGKKKTLIADGSGNVILQ